MLSVKAHKQAATASRGGRSARTPRARCVRVVAEAVSASPGVATSSLTPAQREEVERLERSGAAFQELVSLNETKQSVNRPQKVGTQCV